LPEYVRVFGVDADRMDERALSFTHFIENRCFMRIEEGRCAALAIDPVARTFSCSIYEMRPDVCRSLDRGSGQCRADWELKATRPDVAVERLRAAKAPAS
jgi:Fe-S-cluster containining protein